MGGWLAVGGGAPGGIVHQGLAGRYDPAPLPLPGWWGGPPPDIDCSSNLGG